MLVLTLGVLAVLAFLGARPIAATNTCASTALDDGARVLDLEQADNAALMAAVAGRRGLPARAVTIALATALQESKLANLDHGDRDSLGLFQQRPSQGWGTPEQIMDPVYATGAFYDALVAVRGYEEMEITVAAQAVQRSAFPDAYALHASRARAFASALSGHSPATLTCDLPAQSPAAALPEALAARLARDWGAAPVTSWTDDDGTAWQAVAAVEIVPGADAGTAGWSVGHWATATAHATGATAVVVGDRLWERGVSGWSPAGAAVRQPPGVVLVR